MIKSIAALSLFLVHLSTVSEGTPTSTDDWTHGTPELLSIGELAFGPQGVLFIADPIGAAIFAIKTEGKATAAEGTFMIDGTDAKIASMLGTSAGDLLINDMACHPESGEVFLSVSRGRGERSQPVLVRVDALGEFEAVSLENVDFSRKALANPPKNDPAARRNPRTMSITDLEFIDGRLYVAGLSNEEFASQLRSFAFPFDGESGETAMEIYHGNHGTYETHAPVRTFLPYEIQGQPHLVAAYTCTPLVTFPVSELVDGAKVRGKTVAELGGGNAPLDMISYEKDDRAYILISNSRRGLMKVDVTGLDQAPSITEPVSGVYGVGYDTIEELGKVLQMAPAGEGMLVVLMEDPLSGSIMLANVEMP